MSALTRCAVALGGVALVAASVVTAGSAAAEPVVTPDAQPAISTNLSLMNGWQNYGFGTRPAAVSKLTGIVSLRGAISNGTSGVAFTLPPTYRPAANVYVPVDMCNATKGRLLIQSNGVVTVQAETTFANAQCFTSLESVTWPFVTSGYTDLTLANGWVGAPFSTRTPAIKTVNGVVNFKGAIATSGTDGSPFTIPVGFRPQHTVYARADLCGGTNGRLIIDPSGAVTVQAETNFANAQCFVSLESITYPISNAGYTTIPTINGWTAAGFGTRNVAARSINGYVHLQGSVSTSGSSTNPFNLPPAFRPIATIYAPVDMCGATVGRIVIATNGVVTVQAQTDFGNAACFTSLETVVYRRT